MILIATRHKELAQRLLAELSARGAKVRVLRSHDDLLRECYQAEVSALIADEHAAGLPRDAHLDLLNALVRRVPVLVIREQSSKVSGQMPTIESFADQITVLSQDRTDEIVATAILSYGKPGDGLRFKTTVIPYFNPQIPLSMIKAYGGLGILTLDATGLRKISTDYGNDAYQQTKRVLHDVLFDLWGAPGCVRESDVVCRRSSNSNVFHIFMNSSRMTGSLPYPGVMEKVADRLTHAINNSMWQELFAPKNKRRIPACVEAIPLLAVGFYGVLHNPCIDVYETLEHGLESSKQIAQAQLKRGQERQRELMHTLIQSESLLTSHYQGVFYLQKIDKATAEQAEREKSIAALKHVVFGFEALIRVDQQAVASFNNFDSGIEAQYLRPDVLFSLAEDTHVALELDQACMRQAAKNAKSLPGTLMINILPRNLYHVDRLKTYFNEIEHCMFEVSESEAINNLELMLKACEHLRQHKMGIAADDFGKGYSSLERIIKIRPDVIKFDRSMVQDIDQDPVKQAYVRGLVTAAKILNTTSLVEGVETWAEAEVLKNMGVELIQGFLLHRPSPAKTILSQLEIDENEINPMISINVA